MQLLSAGVVDPHLAFVLLEEQKVTLPAGVVNPHLTLALLQEQVQVLPAGVMNSHLAVGLLQDIPQALGLPFFFLWLLHLHLTPLNLYILEMEPYLIPVEVLEL